MFDYLFFFKKLSISRILSDMTLKRCYFMSVFLCLITSFFLTTVILKNSFNTGHIYISLFFYLALQSLLAFSIIKFLDFFKVLNHKNIFRFSIYKFSTHKITSYFYLISLFTILYYHSLIDIKENNSIFIYIISTFLLIYLPTFNTNEFLTSYSLFILYTSFILFYLPLDNLTLYQVVFLAIVFLPLSHIKYRSLSKEIRLQKKLTSQINVSEKDPLTGLTNRRGLDKKISFAWPFCVRHNISTAVIMIDIDFFKQFNDHYGHPEGDSCIKHVSKAIKQTARRNTDIVARVGGEEFLVFVQETSKTDTVLLAKRIQTNINELKIPHEYSSISNHVTVSIGISYTKPNVSSTFDKLYAKADSALYLSKSNGRNTICIDNYLVNAHKRNDSNKLRPDVFFNSSIIENKIEATR